MVVSPEKRKIDDIESAQPPSKQEKVDTKRPYQVKNVVDFFKATDEYIESRMKNESEKDKESKKEEEKKVLYLDIDNCLIVDGYGGADSFSFRTDDYYTKIIRPGCREFIQEAKKWFTVCFFTSANDRYASIVGCELDATCQVYSRKDLIMGPQAKLKPLSIAFTGSNEEKKQKTLKNAILFDDDPFYAEEAFFNNVVTAQEFEKYKAEVEDPVLPKYLPMLKYLSNVSSVSETMADLKQFWHDKDVVEFLDEDLKLQAQLEAQRNRFFGF